MAGSLKLFATLSLLLVLFFATEMGPIMLGEARVCRTNSKRYSGPCFNNNNNRNQNCNFICRRCEGFEGGHCSSRTCVCTKSC